MFCNAKGGSRDPLPFNSIAGGGDAGVVMDGEDNAT